MGEVMTLESEILEIIRELPGCTARQIAELMPHARNPSARTAGLLAKGMVRKEFIKNPHGHKPSHVSAYFIGDGKPPVPKKLQTKLGGSESPELIKLRQWKAMALERYPDLAVSSEILAARQVVAEYYDGTGDKGRASQARSGQLDKSPVIQIAIKARETSF